MTKILGISAKKQGGKNTSMNFIFGMVMGNLGMFDRFRINDGGELIIPAFDKDKEDFVDMVFDPLARKDEKWFQENLDPHIKAYSFADPLKKFCVDVLGLEHKQCYGTDNDKNTLTKYKWEDFMRIGCVCPSHKQPSDLMTAREVLQQFGTDVMRKLYKSVWVDATLRAIDREQPGIAIICDVRFWDEADGIIEKDGKVMRLMRAPFAGQDEHESETALDNYPRFSAVLDNRDVTITKNNALVLQALIEFWGEEWQI